MVEVVEELKLCMSELEEKPELKAMRERNGAKSSSERKEELESIRAQFYVKHNIPDGIVTVAKDPKLLALWQAWYRQRISQWCGSCKAYHAPTKEHPLHSLCESLHAPQPDGIYFDYRGWKFTPPFICMGCGIEVCFRQWAFSRSCGPCDISHSKTRRILYLKCFAGPHEKLPGWDSRRGDIPVDHFIDPERRLEFPVLYRPKPKLPIHRREPPRIPHPPLRKIP